MVMTVKQLRIGRDKVDRLFAPRRVKGGHGAVHGRRAVERDDYAGGFDFGLRNSYLFNLDPGGADRGSGARHQRDDRTVGDRAHRVSPGTPHGDGPATRVLHRPRPLDSKGLDQLLLVAGPVRSNDFGNWRDRLLASPGMARLASERVRSVWSVGSLLRLPSSDPGSATRIQGVGSGNAYPVDL